MLCLEMQAKPTRQWVTRRPEKPWLGDDDKKAIEKLVKEKVEGNSLPTVESQAEQDIALLSVLRAEIGLLFL